MPDPVTMLPQDPTELAEPAELVEPAELEPDPEPVPTLAEWLEREAASDARLGPLAERGALVEEAVRRYREAGGE